MKQRGFALLLAVVLFLTAPALAVQVDDGSLPQVLTYHGVLALVNRASKVTKKYVPEDLVVPQVAMRRKGEEQGIRMRLSAARALERMFEEALAQGHTLIAASGYRSFGVQDLRFQAKVKEVGTKEKAWRTVAPAGASEHQLGLAMDLQSPSMPRLNRAFGETPEGIWVAQNAHRYGFVIRYQRAWTETTGYLYEPWHVRYLGIAHATAVSALNIPYEDYYEALKSIPEYALLGATDVLLTGLVSAIRSGDLALLQQLMSAAPDEQDAALQIVTGPFLANGQTYGQALERCFPAWAQTEATSGDITSPGGP